MTDALGYAIGLFLNILFTDNVAKNHCYIHISGIKLPLMAQQASVQARVCYIMHIYVSLIT